MPFLGCLRRLGKFFKKIVVKIFKAYNIWDSIFKKRRRCFKYSGGALRLCDLNFVNFVHLPYSAVKISSKNSAYIVSTDIFSSPVKFNLFKVNLPSGSESK